VLDDRNLLVQPHMVDEIKVRALRCHSRATRDALSGELERCAEAPVSSQAKMKEFQDANTYTVPTAGSA